MILSMSTFVVAESLEDLLIDGTADLSGQDRIDAQKVILVENVDLLASEMDTKMESIPGIVKKVIGNTKVNIYFDSGEVIGFVIEDAKVVEIKAEEIEEQTFDVYISDNAFEDLNAGSININNAIKNGDISYDGRGFWGNIKFGMLTTALKILGF